MTAVLRQIWGDVAVRGSAFALAALGVLAPVANTATLSSASSGREAANAFTSMNAGVFLALLVGVLATTSKGALSMRSGLAFRRAVGVYARVCGLLGASAVVAFGVTAAAIALPILNARGLRVPHPDAVLDFGAREIVAGLRLAIVGVAVGVLLRSRSMALIAMIVLLAVDAVIENAAPGVQAYGPIGALNAFSDPSHHHQFSVGVGGAIALVWAIPLLLIATIVSEARSGPRRTSARHDSRAIAEERKSS